MPTKTEFTVCQHMEHWTVILNDDLLQWNKTIRTLSSWGDNVYGYDFNGEMWRKMNHKMTGIGRFFCVQILKVPESDHSFYGFSATSTLLPSCHLAFIVFGSFWIIMSEVRKINEPFIDQCNTSLMDRKSITAT